MKKTERPRCPFAAHIAALNALDRLYAPDGPVTPQEALWDEQRNAQVFPPEKKRNETEQNRNDSPLRRNETKQNRNNSLLKRNKTKQE